MTKTTLCTLGATLAMAFSLSAQQPDGGITPTMLDQIRRSWQPTPAEKALQNAIASTDIGRLAAGNASRNSADTYFSHRVRSRGITDQKSSGRCWLYTGLNVFRAKAIAKHRMGDFQFSQTYSFFWDQLEKSNLFLQGVIDTRRQPMDDRQVEWLFKNTLGDGGQFTGVADLLTKYGVVPAGVMPDTYSSENTRHMSRLIGLKLKEYGLQLRQAAAKGATESALQQQKTTMLAQVYRMLALNLGEPPTSFEWTLTDTDGKPRSTKTYTPKTFYDEFIGVDLKNNYVMLMNDPSREYYKLYEIDYDRHTYDGRNWTYVNLPVDDIKPIAIASIKDSTMMYFSCDVGQFLNRDRGLLDLRNFDYASLMGIDFGMDKQQRIQTFSSASSHAMTLMAVDLDANGKPKKWMVENSWGNGANGGHLIMTDEWFDNYMFRVVVEKKYVPERVQKLLDQQPIRLPAWDPMFAPEE